jgi:hypothetical protein
MNAPRRRRPPTTAPTPIPAFAPVLRLEGGDGGVDAEGVGDVMGVEGEDSGTADVVVDIVPDDDVIGVVVDVGRLMVVDAAHVRASPLVEVIVKFPPSTPVPSLARFGYRLK